MCGVIKLVLVLLVMMMVMMTTWRDEGWLGNQRVQVWTKFQQLVDNVSVGDEGDFKNADVVSGQAEHVAKL